MRPSCLHCLETVQPGIERMTDLCKWAESRIKVTLPCARTAFWRFGFTCLRLIRARINAPHCVNQIYSEFLSRIDRFIRHKVKDENVLCRQVSCTGEDVGAKFTSDETHAFKTRSDWLIDHYLARLSMSSPQHMPRVLAIHRLMTTNVLSRRRVRY